MLIFFLIDINIFILAGSADKTFTVFGRVGGEWWRQATSQSSTRDYLREKSSQVEARENRECP